MLRLARKVLNAMYLARGRRGRVGGEAEGAQIKVMKVKRLTMAVARVHPPMRKSRREVLHAKADEDEFRKSLETDSSKACCS